MKIVFLGTGGSWPSPERNVSAIAVKRGSEVLLFDCGEGTQRQLMKSTVSFMQVSKIFITHFHGDHFLGLPGLLQSMSLNDRKTDLEIYGPEGCSDLILTIMNLGYYNPTYPVQMNDVKPGDILEFEEYNITVAEASHNVPAIFYSLEEKERPGKFNKARALELGIPEGKLFSLLQSGKNVEHKGKTFTPDMVLGPPRPGRKIVYTGDTKPCDSIIEMAKDCDVLIHDSTTALDLEDRANFYCHSSSRQAAEAAKNANAIKLFLTHISPRYDEVEQLEADAKAIFENSQVAEDFLEYEVKYKE
ncbi:MAG: ribonuclease Z [Thermoplasmata archaeon]|nr:ribonuclease Z [Thermoplasmata archaeon]